MQEKLETVGSTGKTGTGAVKPVLVIEGEKKLEPNLPNFLNLH